MDLMVTLSLLGCTSRTELPLWGWVITHYLFGYTFKAAVQSLNGLPSFVLHRHPSIKQSSKSELQSVIISEATSKNVVLQRFNLLNSNREQLNQEHQFSKLITSRETLHLLNHLNWLNRCVWPLIWRESLKLDLFLELKTVRLLDSESGLRMIH